MLFYLNFFLLCYVLPVLLAYLSAKFYYTFTKYDKATLGTILLIFTPLVNLFFIIYWLSMGMDDYSTYLSQQTCTKQ